MPKVSVIMPVYNAEEFLVETINSVLSQTFIDFEFLIVDDGSTDKSMQILKSYNDPRIKVFKNNQNLGYVKTLNNLIELSNGEYIARQDNDDISLPERLEKQVSFLNKNYDIGICGSNALVFGELNKKTLVPIEDKKIRAYMIINNPMLHPTVMYRKSLFENLNISKYDESLCPAEDYGMWFEISKKTKLANLPDILLKYRWHKNSTSQIKKNIQIEKANNMRKSILQYSLSYDISEDDNMLFSFISNPELMSVKKIKSFESLLMTIQQKNIKIGYYNEIELRDLFFYFWIKICIKNKRSNIINKLKICLSSELFKFSSLFNFISLKNINNFIYNQNN